MQIKNQTNIGIFYALCAFGMWGIFPMFFKLFDKEVGAVEILAHRVIFSLIFMWIIMIYTNGKQKVINLIKNKKIRNMLGLNGILIGINWGIYIYAVNAGDILQASLGYFINPLMNIVLGVLILKEGLKTSAKISLAIVVLAVFLQVISLGYLPLISILLPASFAFYTLIKKQIAVSALEGLFVETLMLLPFVVAYEFYLSYIDQNHFGFNYTGLLMMLCGVVTVLPLLAFNAATVRLNLTTVGYLQYISPTMSMLIAIFIYQEKIDIYKISSFILIWIALAIIGIGKFLKPKNNAL